MAMVRVWNDNVYEHTERFRGAMVTIPAGKFIEMPAEDAVLFKSQFTPIIRGKSGVDDPRGFKKIRIEYNPQPIVEDVVAKHEQSLTCQACGFVAKTDKDLKSHIRSTHVAQMLDDDAREALVKEV